jgi:hypothetical protein
MPNQLNKSFCLVFGEIMASVNCGSSYNGASTINIMTFSIITFSIMQPSKKPLGKMALSIMPLSIMIYCRGVKIYITLYIIRVIVGTVMLNVVMFDALKFCEYSHW